MLSAHVPRNLRVRSSIQLSSARVPARAFLIVAGLCFCGGLAIVAGADLMRTIKLTGTFIVIGLLVFELRCWGRSTTAVAAIIVRHYRRPRRLRLDQPQLTPPDAPIVASPARLPRWQT